jgi:RNA polymerase sigma-54 factor
MDCMAISLQTGLKQSPGLVMNQTLKQAIELLQLSTVELHETIARELAENPILEEDAAQPAPPLQGADLSTGVSHILSGDETSLSGVDERAIDLCDTSDSGIINDDEIDKRTRLLETLITREESLAEHLMWQARLAARTEAELELYQIIITSLDGNGFLCKDFSRLVAESGHGEDTIRELISSVQLFDPVGCAASDVRESLIIQCRHYYSSDSLLVLILTEYFPEFEQMDYRKIARSLNLPLRGIMEKSKVIQNLDPYPGSHYCGEAVRYIIPDVEVRLVDGEIIVSLNDDWIPAIRINPFYRTLLKKKNIEKKLREYIQDKMQSAQHLMRNIASRRNTILRVVRSIMEHQRDFLARGPGHLKPLTHSDIAVELRLHESTVSRTTSNKYVQTVWGLLSLKCFFVSRLRSECNGPEASSDKVMRLIRDVIEREDSARPYSDEKIVAILGNANVRVARRTVAKYREILHIPPSHMRKKINLIKQGEQK